MPDPTRDPSRDATHWQACVAHGVTNPTPNPTPDPNPNPDQVCVAHGITKKGEKLVCPIDDNGRFTEEVPDYKGMPVKEADKVSEP